MNEKGPTDWEVFCRCEKQGQDLARNFKRDLDDAVKLNLYQLPNFFWPQSVCVAEESLLRVVVAPERAISAQEGGNGGKKRLDPEYVEFGLEECLGQRLTMARKLNDWRPGAVYSTDKPANTTQQDRANNTDQEDDKHPLAGLSLKQLVKLLGLLEQGQRFAAIMTYQEIKQTSVTDARDAVDRMAEYFEAMK